MPAEQFFSNPSEGSSPVHIMLVGKDLPTISTASQLQHGSEGRRVRKHRGSPGAREVLSGGPCQQE